MPSGSIVYRSPPPVRVEENTIRDPSGEWSAVASTAGCVVRRCRSWPSGVTDQRSTSPSLTPVKTMRDPSGEEVGSKPAIEGGVSVVSAGSPS